MEINKIWKELKKYGIHNEKELDEAIKKLPPLNIGGFVNKLPQNKKGKIKKGCDI